MSIDSGPETVLQVVDQTKSFAHVVANDCISFDVKMGEIHCLLGENGAGKSTLCKCLYGAYKPDSGRIYSKGEEIQFLSPRDAIGCGIGMVHQHSVLVPPMTVLENIIAGTESTKFWLDQKTARRRVEVLCSSYQIDVDLDEIVSRLSIGQQQWVEMLKTLYVGVEILILDEPTAALTPQETEKLFTMLRKMSSDGMAIVLITHKLHEAMSISDRITVLRKGRVIATRDTRDVTKEELARMMVGRDVVFEVEKDRLAPGDVVFATEGLYALKDNGQEALHDVSIEIRRNEILGLAGVGGNGQQELFDVIVGVRPVEKGEILLNGESIADLSPSVRSNRGLASIPPDRINQGLLMGFSVAGNLILGFQRHPRFTSGLFLSDKETQRFAAQSIEAYDIATYGPNQIAGELSGGNLQKLILARELSHRIEFVVASSPTRGLDVGATEYVHRRLIELRDKGAGVFLISEDLDEMFNVSDRIAVIYDGQIMGIFDVDEVGREKVGLLMAGVRDGDL